MLSTVSAFNQIPMGRGGLISLCPEELTAQRWHLRMWLSVAHEIQMPCSWCVTLIACREAGAHFKRRRYRIPTAHLTPMMRSRSGINSKEARWTTRREDFPVQNSSPEMANIAQNFSFMLIYSVQPKSRIWRSSVTFWSVNTSTI